MRLENDVKIFRILFPKNIKKDYAIEHKFDIMLFRKKIQKKKELLFRGK